MVAGHSVEFVNRELETVSKQLLSGDVTVVGEQSDGEGWGRKELPQQTSEMTLQWCQRLRLEGKTLKNTVFHEIPFPNFLDCNSRLLSLVEVFRCSQWQPVRERKAKVNSKNIWCCHRVRPNVPGTTKDSGVAFNFFIALFTTVYLLFRCYIELETKTTNIDRWRRWGWFYPVLWLMVSPHEPAPYSTNRQSERQNTLFVRKPGALESKRR